MAEVYVTKKRDLGVVTEYILSDGSIVSEDNLPAGISFGPPQPAPPPPPPPPPPPVQDTVQTANPPQVGPISPKVAAEVKKDSQQRKVTPAPMEQADEFGDITRPKPKNSYNAGADGPTPAELKGNTLAGADGPGPTDYKKSSTGDDAYNIGDDGEFGTAPSNKTVADVTSSAKNIGQKIERKITTESNVLDAYVNYTYNFDLYMLDKDSYNSMVDNPNDDSAFTSNLLISTGDKRIGRNAIFDDQFYIDDLEMQTITPTTSTSRSTNVTNIKFKIIEPYGISLLERLQDLIRQKFPSSKPKMYSQMPYLLKLSFVGYDDLGQPHKIKNSTRYIPIKLVNITFDVNEGGAIYSVQAMPYNLAAMDGAIESLPINIEVSGITIKDFLTDGAKKVTIEKERRENQHGDFIDEKRVVGNATSLKKLLKDYNDGLTLTGSQKIRPGDPVVEREASRTTADEYNFEFYDDIKNSKILYTTPQIDQLPNTKNEDDYLSNYVSNINKKVQALYKNKNAFKLNRGTSIVKAIESLMLQCEYTQSQLNKQIKKSGDNDEALHWFKITPNVKLLDWDDKIGRFALDIKYIVSKYLVFNINFNKAPRGKPGGDGVHKKYDYMFTGSNNDVLNFDIKYNIAYFRQSSIQTGDDAQPHENDTPGTDDGYNSTNNATTGAEQTALLSQSDTGGGGQTARDLAKTVLTEGPEMVGLNLEIIGDPAYIMQSDIFYQDHLLPENNVPLTPFLPDKSINYDYSNPIISINFRYPTDYEDNGLMNLTSKKDYRASDDFSGVYRVTHVDHTFTGGQFQQRLRGVRMFETKDKANSKKSPERTVALTETKQTNAKGKHGRSKPPKKIKIEKTIQEETAVQDDVNAASVSDSSIKKAQEDHARRQAEQAIKAAELKKAQAAAQLIKNVNPF